jgi:hypothetical protein
MTDSVRATTDEYKLDNPAGRLGVFLERFFSTPGNSIGERVAKIYHLDAEDRPRQFECLAQVLALPDEIHNAILSRPDIPDTFLLIVDEVKPLFNLFLGLQNGIPINQGPASTLFGMLRLCSDALSRQSEPPIAPDDRENLRQSILDLIEQVRNAEAGDPQLLEFLLSELHRLLYALDAYELTGIEGLRRAYAAVVGEVQIMRPLVEDTPPNRNLVARFADVCQKYGSLVNLASAAALGTQTFFAAIGPHR